MRRISLDGKRFGRIEVISFAYTRKNATYWVCACDCGNITTVCGQNLRSGHTKSCGCFKVDTTRQRLTKHGHAGKYTRSVEYLCWQNMLKRCYYPKSNRFKYYGERGITVCARWHKFENFFEDMGYKPLPELSIERKNNNGHYEPANCIWATDSEQMHNRSM